MKKLLFLGLIAGVVAATVAQWPEIQTLPQDTQHVELVERELRTDRATLRRSIAGTPARPQGPAS